MRPHERAKVRLLDFIKKICYNIKKKLFYAQFQELTKTGTKLRGAQPSGAHT